MTINDAIAMVDVKKPNQYDTSMKIEWLSKLDGMVFLDVFCTHEGNPAKHFRGYTLDTDADTKLLVPHPYDEDIYNYFLQAQIDSENGEMAKYNVSITLFNDAMKRFQDFWNRTHMPIRKMREFVI